MYIGIGNPAPETVRIADACTTLGTSPRVTRKSAILLGDMVAKYQQLG